MTTEPSLTGEYCPLIDALTAAYHEAGHAVTAQLVDPPRTVEWVRIDEPDANGCGGRTHYEGEDGPLPYGIFGTGGDNSRHAESDAVVAILGPLCAMWFATGRFKHDEVLAEDVRSTLDYCLFERLDWDRVVLISALLHLSFDGEAERWRELMLERALDLLGRPGFLESVVAVAGALMRQKTLDGSEVEALVRAARSESSPT
jgi:hypothetical protein